MRSKKRRKCQCVWSHKNWVNKYDIKFPCIKIGFEVYDWPIFLLG
jgi:hypothetical protein